MYCSYHFWVGFFLNAKLKKSKSLYLHVHKKNPIFYLKNYGPAQHRTPKNIRTRNPREYLFNIIRRKSRINQSILFNVPSQIVYVGFNWLTNIRIQSSEY